MTQKDQIQDLAAPLMRSINKKTEGFFKTGRSAAKRAGTQQRAQIAEQRQLEKRKLAEEDSELARRKALIRSGAAGRSLLIKTSQTGTQSASTLGGT